MWMQRQAVNVTIRPSSTGKEGINAQDSANSLVPTRRTVVLKWRNGVRE